MDHLTGQTFKGYELRECLGEGGFGAVYRAFQPLLGRDVAVKVIRAEFANHPDFIRRFETEAQVIARLEHPHIVPLYDYWRDPAGAFLVMRWLRGGSLHDALTAGPLSLPETVRLLEQLTAALSVAHRRGVIHRDLKPGNVLRDEEGNAYLADFGIAKDLGTNTPGSTTASDVMVGSPLYMAPEQIKHEPTSAQTDIYLLGVLLYEVLTGQQPFAGATPTDILYQHLYEALPSLRVQRPDLPRGLDTILQRATQKPAGARYPDVLSLLADFAVASEVTAEPPVTEPQALPAKLSALGVPENPYKGLRAFQEADAADFFGRAALVERLLPRLGKPTTAGRFLAVVGPSGSGKSSVVRAGLLPVLRQGATPGSERWFFTEFVPGPHPLEELEVALLRVAVNPPVSLLEQFQADARGLSRAVKRVLPADDRTELVLLIDQFEEIFTLVEDEAIRAHLLRSLALAVTDPRSRLRVILTLRADFYDRPLLYPELGELMRQGTELVLPLSAQELEQAIARPAARAGVTLEPMLLATMIKDVGDQPGALPLLQYALTELFEDRDGRQMTLVGYQASGGILGALAWRAEEIYAALSPDAQELGRQVFLRLVTLGEGVEDMRRRVRQSELAGLGPAKALGAVLDGFGQYRLLTFDRDPITRAPTVEVAHEALLRTWGRLREWLDGSRANLRVQRQLAAASAEWARAGQEASYLASGTRLVQFAALAATGDVALTDEERAYLAASVAERERQTAAEQERQARELELARQAAAAAEQVAKTQQHSTQRLRILVGIMAVLLLGLAGLVTYASTQQSEAQAFGQHAQASAATAVANQTLAQEQRQQAQANYIQSEAQRLAAEANALLQERGNSTLTALLAIRSLRTQYTAQGDADLEGAATLEYPRQLLVGHTVAVTSVAFSPDGKQVFTGSHDTTARLWDVQTGQEVRHFTTEPPADVLSVAFAPNGKQVLISSINGTIQLWSIEGSKPLWIFYNTSSAVYSVAFSPDSKYIVAGGEDWRARLWDVQTHRELQQFIGHLDEIDAVSFSPDSKYILTGSRDKTARLWDIQTASPVLTFTGHTEPITAVAFSPDGKHVLTGSYDKTARLWDSSTGAELRRFTGHTDVVTSVAFAPDGKTVLTGSDDQTARLWDTMTGAELRYFAGHPGGVLAVAFAADGQTVASGGVDQVVRLWSTNLKPYLPQFIGHTASVYSARFSPDGKQVVTASWDRTARLWDARTGAELRRFDGHTDWVFNATLALDGRTLVTGSMDGTIRLWDAATGTELKVSTFTNSSRSSLFNEAFSPDGQFVLIDSEDGLWLLDAKTGDILSFFPSGHISTVVTSAFAPNGETVLTGNRDGTVYLLNVTNRELLRVFLGHTSTVFAVAFAPDGKTVLTGSGDKTARLWDVATGRELRRLIGHTGGVWSVAFAPDGKTVLTGGKDETARLWDVASGIELRRFVGHTAGVHHVDFSPDGKRVLTASEDGTARVWDTDYHDTIRYLCGRLLRDFTDAERTQYGILDTNPTCPGP